MFGTTIKTRILVSVAGIVVINGVFTVLYFPAQQKRQALDSFGEEVQSIANTVALGIEIALATGDFAGVGKAIEYAKANENIRFVHFASGGETLASFPEEFELSEAVLASDTIAYRRATVASEAIPGEVVVGMSTAGIQALLQSVRLGAFLVVIGTFLLGGLLAFRLSRSIAVRLGLAQEQLRGLARGRLQEVTVADAEDEVGRMTTTLNTVVAGIRGALETDSLDWQEIAEQRRQERVQREREEERVARERDEARQLQVRVDQVLTVVRAAAEGDLSESIDGSDETAIGQISDGLDGFFADLRVSMDLIRSTSGALARSAEELSGVSDQMQANASSTTGQARSVGDAVERISSDVGSVAVASEGLRRSIAEIATNTTQATQVASDAVRLADQASEAIHALGVSGQEVETVAKDISDLAAQTNLLALNATIEAARAGEAGKGFAVVAHEVKELAAQSARAADDVDAKIRAIRRDGAAAVEAVQRIHEIISQIDVIQVSIAGAIEEQTSVTEEIGNRTGSAADDTVHIASSLESVTKAAERTAQGFERSQDAIEELARIATELEAMVSRFRCDAEAPSSSATPA